MKYQSSIWNLAFFASVIVLLSLAKGDKGINICGPNLCFCDTGLAPIEISCDGLDLHSVWEDTDWNATFKALNLTGKEALSVTFLNNELTHIPRFPSINITVLSFQRNKIKSIEPSAFANLENLDSLNLAHNELTSDGLYEGAFYGKGDLTAQGYFPLPTTHLNLSYNNIHSLPKNTFEHFNELLTLDLANNPLVTLEGNTKYAIGNLIKLQFLGLSNTKISGLPEGLLHDLNHLTALDLSFNEFKQVPTELSHTHQLIVLSLDGNKFEKLDKDSFSNLGSLEDLSICYINTLREIEQFTFTPLKNLTKLVIAFNPHLKEIDDGAFENLIDSEHVDDWPVKDIRLNDNGLNYVDQALLPWSKLDYIDIQNNPFRCDCNAEWMIFELSPQIRHSNPTLAIYLTCAEPKDMKGKSIVNLEKERETFSRCGNGKSSRGGVIDGATASDPYKAASVTILVIGVLLVVIGLTILGFVALKQRTISQSLLAPSQIRYERADTEDGSEWKYSTNQPGIHK